MVVPKPAIRDDLQPCYVYRFSLLYYDQMKRYPIRKLIIDRFNPLERTSLELSGGSRPRLVLQYRRTKKRVLIKSYTHNPHEIYSEYLASRLAAICELPAQSAVLKVIPPHVVQWLKDEAGDVIGKYWKPITVEVANIFPDNIQVVYGKDILGNPEKRTTLVHVENSLSERYGNCEDLVQSYMNMVVFDAFIGNMDRHHENWGICISEKFRKSVLLPEMSNYIDFSKERYFTPLFDHGSSLMFELPETKLISMNEDTDLIARYANKKYGFILTPSGEKGNVFDILTGYSNLSEQWKVRVKKAVGIIIDNDFVDYQNVIERMPINNDYGWTTTRKDVIIKCLQIRYNYIQQLS